MNNLPKTQNLLKSNSFSQNIQKKYDHKNYSNLEFLNLQDTLGRPVIRIIQDKQGKIILNIGDLVTYQALEAAKKANVIDILLNSIYK